MIMGNGDLLSEGESARRRLLEVLKVGTTPDAIEYFRRETARCRDRNYNEQGIPMILALEDLGGGALPSVGESPVNKVLADAMTLALEAQDGADEATVRVAKAAEVVADLLFLLGAPVDNEPLTEPGL